MESIATAVNAFVQRLVDQVGGDAVSTTASDEFDRPASVAVRNVNGPITIVGSERDSVALRYTKRGPSADALERVTIETWMDEAEGLFVEVVGADSSSVTVDIVLDVPRTVPIESVRTANGTIDVREARGDSTIRTQNGTITVIDHDGFVDLRCTNGTVEANDVVGVDRVETVNGTIALEIESIRTDVDVRSSTGEIDLVVGNIDATVSLETSLGSIDAPLFGESRTSIGHTVVNGRLGTGAHELTIVNSVGSIQFDSMEPAE